MTIPGYDPTVPKAKQLFNTSQAPFLSNFSTLFNAFKVNHVSLDDAVDSGFHTKIELPQQTQSFQSSEGEISVYSRRVKNQPKETDQTVQLYMRYQGNPDEFRYSNYQIYTLDPLKYSNGTVKQTRYITFLPGNVLVYFGEVNTNNTFGKLELEPYISKSVLCANFCSKNVAAYAPTIGPIKSDDGIYRQIQIGFVSVAPILPPYYYVVMTQT